MGEYVQIETQVLLSLFCLLLKISGDISRYGETQSLRILYSAPLLRKEVNYALLQNAQENVLLPTKDRNSIERFPNRKDNAIKMYQFTSFFFH